MISTIWKEAYVKACDLPPFCYLIGECDARIPVRVKFGGRSKTVIIIPADGIRGAVYNANHVFHALIPESWEDSKLDIEFGLMLKGAM